MSNFNPKEWQIVASEFAPIVGSVSADFWGIWNSSYKAILHFFFLAVLKMFMLTDVQQTR